MVVWAVGGVEGMSTVGIDIGFGFAAIAEAVGWRIVVGVACKVALAVGWAAGRDMGDIGIADIAGYTRAFRVVFQAEMAL